MREVFWDTSSRQIGNEIITLILCTQSNFSRNFESSSSKFPSVTLVFLSIFEMYRAMTSSLQNSKKFKC